MDRIKNAPRTVFICALLAILTWAAFWPMLHNGFVNYDDPEYVTENPHVQTGLTAANIGWALTGQHGGNWHPLTSLSHMVDVKLFGLQASWHHAVNLLFHSVNVILLYLLLEGLTGGTWRSACVAALFAVHPMHVESVAWVAERKDVLSGFFGLLTLMAYAKYVTRAEDAKSDLLRQKHYGGQEIRNPKSEASSNGKIRIVYYCLALVLFALGLLSKPMLVTLPCVMLLLDYWPLQRGSRAECRGVRKGGGLIWGRLVVEKIPFFALSVASSVMTLWAQRKTGAVSSLEAVPFEFRISNAMVSYVRYLAKIIWPSNLAVFYPIPTAKEWPIEAAAAAAILLIAITAVSIWLTKKVPQLPVGWIWFVVTLVPVIGLIQVGRQAMADRYSYVPSIGIFIAVVWLTWDWLAQRPAAKRWIAAVTVGVVAICAAMTWRQASYWRDTRSLFEHALAATGENAEAQNTLGTCFLKANDWAGAELHFTEAARIQRNFPEALANLGLCRERAGGTNEAKSFYERAIQIRPTASAYYNLANLLSKQGELEKAETNYRSALELKPEFPEALYNCGALLARQGRVDEAARNYASALKLKPDLADVHLSFGALLAGQQKWDEAIAEFAAGLQSDPSNANIHFNLGAAYNAKGEVGEAAKHYAEACRLRPDDAEARENLGLLLLSQGKANEAMSCFQESLRLQPNARAHYELALALDASGQGEKAITQYREAVRLSPTSALYLNDLAWALATNPNEKMRDIKEAVRLAEDACRLSGGREPRFFGTLDAAYAGAGRFEEAITTASKTRELALAAGQQQIAQKAEERLALYRAGKPYHSPPPNP